jgi:hypothetical protein
MDGVDLKIFIMERGMILWIVVALVLSQSFSWAQPARLVSSTNAMDDYHPCAGLVASGNSLYGATAGGAGGYWGYGTVFSKSRPTVQNLSSCTVLPPTHFRQP